MKIIPALAACCILFLTAFAPAAFADPSGAPSFFPSSPHDSSAGNAVKPAPLKNFSVTRAPRVPLETGEGTLACDSDPAGAEVRLDGVSMGEAPLRKEHIKSGAYSVAFSKWGYEDSVEKIRIKKDVTMTIEETLAQARGSIRVQSDPQGAAVYLDGREVGVTPVMLTQVSGGTHRIALSKEYFEPEERQDTMPVGGNHTIRVRLKRRLLFINTGGADRQASDAARRPVAGQPPAAEEALAALGRLHGLRIITLSVDKLKGILCSRELDPASLDFLECRKNRLNLEDAAVLSSILEQERAELALTISEKQEAGAEVVSLSLYSSRSAIPDAVTIRCKDYSDLKAGLDRFISQWEGQSSRSANSVGGGRAAEAEAAPEDSHYLFNLALTLIPEKQNPDCGERITLGNAYLRAGEYGRALKAYQGAVSQAGIGICRGTALYRMAQTYEKMGRWTEAASSYSELCLLYPDATLVSPDGPKAAPLAVARMKSLFGLGLVKERWWL